MDIKTDFSVSIEILNPDGETVCQVAHAHQSLDGAARAYGHAVRGLMEHYRDERHRRDALDSAEREKVKPAPLTADDFIPAPTRFHLINEHGLTDLNTRQTVSDVLNHVHRLIRETLAARA